MQSYMLNHTGRPPLKFDGELIAEENGENYVAGDVNRWHTLRLYRADSGEYVVEIIYISNWRGELAHAEVITASEPQAIVDALQGTVIAAHVAGYPPHPSFEAKQARLLADLQRQYDVQVSALLATAIDLGYPFAEKL